LVLLVLLGTLALVSAVLVVAEAAEQQSLLSQELLVAMVVSVEAEVEVVDRETPQAKVEMAEMVVAVWW
jgi:hypothetical protein